MSDLAAQLAALTPEQRQLLTLRLRKKNPTLLKLQPIPRRTGAGPWPLTYEQERLWVVQQLFPSGTAFNVNNDTHFRGSLDMSALIAALTEVVRRHEILRTTFAARDGVPFQAVGPATTPALPRVDLSALPQDLRSAEQRRLVLRRARLPFDLAVDGPLRLALLRLAPDHHILLINLHHIATDWWSANVLQNELGSLYRALARGERPELPEPPIQYADFAVWQRSWLPREIAERNLLDYWRERMAGAPAEIDLPRDRPRPPVSTFAGARLPFLLAPETADGLRSLARGREVTPFILILAAYAALLSRISRQNDFLVGTPVADRGRPETEHLIGYFLNNLVFRLGVAAGCSFAELLAHTRRVVNEAYAHQDLPFGLLLEEIRPERSLNRAPLFQAAFVFVMVPAPRTPEEATEEGVFDPGTSRVDLTLVAEDMPQGGIRAFWEYSTELFDPATIARLAGHFQNVLAGIVAAPAARVSELPVLSAAERAALLFEWNDTASADSWDGGAHDLFRRWARRAPQAPAVSAGERHLTYAELDRLSDRLAARLRCLEVGPEVPVGVALERTAELLVALLGVLKAGGAYVPLDPAYPRERLEIILADAGVGVLIAAEDVAARLFAGGCPPLPVVAPELPEQEPSGADPVPAPPATEPGDLAYVLFTSGSTGRPKGVEVTHASLANLLRSMIDILGITAADKMLCVTSPSFDMSVMDLLLPLVSGATLVLAGRDEARDERLLSARLIRSEITFMQATPATWQMLVACGWEGARSLTVLCGGEALSAPLARGLRERAGALWNLYGPTEACVWATLTRLDETAPVTLGRPFSGVRVHVLDPDLQPVPVGVAGEICIGGRGVARGYRRRPDLTAERFAPDPFATGHRMYRTGDLARQRPDGAIEFLGRLDQQVKVRGFRVELGEIETVLGEHPGVEQAAVVARRGGDGQPMLVAYLVRRSGAAGEDLRGFLRAKLPEYMIPAFLVDLPELPLSANGKVDRNNLPAPQVVSGLEGAATATRTPTEEILAGLWSLVLGVPQVGPGDDFFALGGHSLSGMQVVSRVRRVFGVELELAALFQAPTLAALAARIDKAVGGPPQPPLEPQPREGLLPLSFAQERLWFEAQLDPNSSAYNIPNALRLRGPLSVPVLSRTLDEIVRRHEALRTTFGEVDGEPVQVVHPPAPCPLPVIDLRSLPNAERQAEVGLRIAQEAGRPFDLAAGPLLRTVLLRVEEEEHAVLFTMHHIVSDGWSMRVLIEEVTRLYRAFLAGEPAPLPELPVQYADYALWQRRVLDAPALEGEKAFWRGRLAGMRSDLDLPTDRPRPSRPTYAGDSVPLAVPGDLAGRLAAFSRAEGVTLFMTVLAAFQTLLRFQASCEEVVLGTVLANRDHTSTEGLIGFFVNQLVLRTDLSGDPTFRELLGRVREVVLEAHTHSNLPFEKVVEAVNPDRAADQAPLFQVRMAFNNVPLSRLELPGLLLSGLEVGLSRVQLDLIFSLAASGDTLAGILEFRTELFDRRTIERMREQFLLILVRVLERPDLRLSEIDRLLAERWRAEQAERDSAAEQAALQRLRTLRASGALPRRGGAP